VADDTASCSPRRRWMTRPRTRGVIPRRRTPGELERQRIIQALEKTGGNQKEAAKLLGVSRRTLVYRLDTYAVPRPRKRAVPAN
jgi:DNA-binding NtrC family response regulator